MLKTMCTTILFIALFLVISLPAWGLDAPTITAIAKGPNQIILTWPAVSNPGWGYRVEIQSDGDSRYATYTELNWQNGLSVLPPWVTESGGTQKIHTDPSTASSGWGDDAQANVYGLKYGTLYNFRVRTWAQTDAGVDTYSAYSDTASDTTTTPTTIRYVSTTGNDNNSGTSWADAWRHLSYADGQVSAGALVLVDGGNYASDGIDATGNGTPGTGRIVFQADYGEIPVITSRNAPSIILLDQNYWIVDGIKTTAASNGNAEPILITGHRNVLTNSEIDGSTETKDVWGFVSIFGTYNLVHNSHIHDCCGNTDHDQQNSTLISLYNENADYNTIQYSHMRNGSHDNTYSRGDYNRILNNLCDGGLGHGFLMHYTADYNLAEGNYIVDVGKNYNTSIVYKPGIQISAANHTVRRNIVVDGKSYGSAADNTIGIEFSNTDGGIANNNLVYNNTVAHNGGGGAVFWGGNGNQLKNNIFYDNAIGAYDGAKGILEDSSASNNDIQNNLILDVSANGDENPGETVISWNYDDEVTLAYANANYPDFSNNLDNYSPLFINYSSRSWNGLHLQSSSELIDQGVSVADPVWGTIPHSGNGPDVGAFEYMGVSNSPPTTDPPPTKRVTFESIGAEDGWVKESGENTNVGGALNTTGTGSLSIRAGDDRRERQYIFVLSFDTSSIPDDATVSSATLELTRGKTTGTNPFNTHGSLLLDLHNGTIGGDASLASSDFQAVVTHPDAVTVTNQGDFGSTYSVDLSTALSAVNKTGRTQIRGRFSQDVDHDQSNDFAGFYSSDNSSAAKHPRLIVTYDHAAPVCGNGILETGEPCDDGNTAPGDGCSAVCTIE